PAAVGQPSAIGRKAEPARTEDAAGCSRRIGDTNGHRVLKGSVPGIPHLHFIGQGTVRSGDPLSGWIPGEIRGRCLDLVEFLARTGVANLEALPASQNEPLTIGAEGDGIEDLPLRLLLLPQHLASIQVR